MLVPNLMFFGFSKNLKLRVRTLDLAIKTIRELGLSEDAVVTIVDGDCVSCYQGLPAKPFIRICGTDPLEIERIVEALQAKNLGIDCETLLLTEFYSASQMTTIDDTDDEPA